MPSEFPKLRAVDFPQERSLSDLSSFDSVCPYAEATEEKGYAALSVLIVNCYDSSNDILSSDISIWGFRDTCFTLTLLLPM